MEVLEFKTEEIKLKDLLKATDLIPSGGLAKLIIREEGVLLNNEPCYIAGKKIHPGDEVIFDEVKIIIK
ncbi:RNA-binding S4 domain-containing protein [uncultured Anaerococcus sp.]|uniref:RNA-binding S4 domain-containing protein n=1 Tax=uncultured Anaerococcus sp. TaxID=293428 RepID=UPI00261027EC|nr:RNA-binding S4 domain-containing protein [uncultured Anaerococcus sp.]